MCVQTVSKLLHENDLSMKNYYFAFKILLILVITHFSMPLIAQNTEPDTVVLTASLPNERNIGFGKQQEEIITSAISTRKGTELRSAFTNNIGNTFYGRFPGLTVNQGGNEPGANSAGLFIRGANTFGFNQAPLVIIDGFIGDFSQLVPEEIEEISILKDASATAIYGMRGANGVILVTTKKGVNQPLAVSFGAQYGIQQTSGLPQILDAHNYASLYNEALANDGRSPLYSQRDLDSYRNGTDPFFYPNVDWYNEVFRKSAPLANYNLNFKGGNNTVRYFAMLNALSSQGMYRKFGDENEESSNPTYNLYNFRVNLDITVNKNLSAQLNIGGSVEEKANPGDLTTGGNLSLMDRIPPNAFPVYNPNGVLGGNATFPGNPLGNVLNTGSSTSTGTNLQSFLGLTQKLDFITPGLSTRVAVSLNSYYLSSNNKRKTYQRANISRNLAGDSVYTNFGQNTSLIQQNSVLSQFRNNSIQASLNYDRSFGKHDFSGLLLFNSDNNDINRNYPNTDAANQALPYKTNNLGSRFTYVNNKKYIAEFSSSYMGAESFPPDSRHGFFPALSLGWVASGEQFLQTSKVINFLKIRASYGLVGNENIGGQRFAFNQRYPFTASYVLGIGNTSAFGIAEGRRANENVTWEKDLKANLGIEAQLGNRFGIILDVYSNKRSDILAPSTGVLPQFLGYNGYPDLNIGEATNNGFEFSVNYHNDKKSALQFNVEAFVAHTKSKINFNGEAPDPNTNLLRTGSAIGQPFGLRAMGIFQTAAEIASSPAPLGIVVQPGDIKYMDIGGPNGVPDGIIDGNDATAIGKTNIPEWTMGLSTGLKYKGFDLNLIFQGVSGFNQYLSGNRFHAFQNNGLITEIALDRWTPQNTGASYPRLSSDNNQNNYRFSSFWQRDGSFIKLRVAEIGYTFSERTLARLKLKESRFFLNGTNLFTLDRIKEGNAEALNGYPQIRTLSLGLRLII